MMLRSKAVLQAIVPKDLLKKRKQCAAKDDEPAPKKTFSLQEQFDNKENIAPGSEEIAQVEFDYDKEEAHNFEAVSDFAKDIFKYYNSREVKFRVVPYMHNHPNLTKKSRAILVDWLVELQETFQLNHETLFHSVKLIDLYLSKTTGAVVADLQKIASAALLIATKFDERCPPLVDDLIYLSGDRFGREELLELERNLLKVVGFDLGSPLSYRYLRRLARVARVEMTDLTLARYLLESTLLVYDFSLISSSKVASACFLLAMRMQNENFEWCSVLAKYSGFTGAEIEPLVPFVNHAVHFTRGSWTQLRNIYDKYASKPFYGVANFTLLADTLANNSDCSLPENFSKF